MNFLKNRPWTSLLALLLLCGGDAISAPLERWINRSTHVALVSVVEGKSIKSAPHRGCAFEYLVLVERDFKGAAGVSRVITDAKLMLGGEYLLVVATDASWASRAIATDVPTLLSEIEKPVLCEKKYSDALLVRSDELRPVREGGIPYSKERSLLSLRVLPKWVMFPVFVFFDAPSVDRVSDMDRIRVTDYRVDWPGVDYSDYFLLEDLIGLLHAKIP